MKRPTPTRAAESRGDTRVQIRSTVELRRFGHDIWEYQGIATDISQGGIGVDVQAVFAVGEVVELRFPEADLKTCHRVRVVYRNNQHHYGFRFLEGKK
jgi:PilZ domain-containing protein